MSFTRTEKKRRKKSVVIAVCRTRLFSVLECATLKMEVAFTGLEEKGGRRIRYDADKNKILFLNVVVMMGVLADVWPGMTASLPGRSPSG